MILKINEKLKYIDEFRDRHLIMKLARLISQEATGNYSFMEVCGGHTAAIHRFGLPELLPSNIRLISGPGCPVCVTSTDFIDKAIACSDYENVVITTFGDLMKVPGSDTTLEKKKAEGSEIRVVLSALDALEIARNSQGKNVVFLAIGFETTAPGTATTVKLADAEKVNNFFILCAHKIMPPAMRSIVQDGANLNGFICPGHVAAITGPSAFEFLPREFDLGCVITGFEPVDLLQSILMLIRQVNSHSPEVEIQYTRAVNNTGNIIAYNRIFEIFETCDSYWRGFGIIPASGLKLQESYRKHDAEDRFQVRSTGNNENNLCICGDILRGIKTPEECPLYSVVCIPDNPVGACMVSAEGSCNNFYRYRYRQ